MAIAGGSPFVFDGPLPRGQLVGRDVELERLVSAALAGRLVTVYAPRRYGKTSLLGAVIEVLRDAHRMAAVLVDLLGVVSLTDLTVRLEQAYARDLRGPLRRRVDALFAAQGLGLSLSGGGFGLTVSRQPRTDPLPALHALLDLPRRMARGERAYVVFDEFQSVMAVEGAEAIVRSHVQHHRVDASYAFAGSEPGLMQQAFGDRRRPLYGQAEPLRLGRLADDAVLAITSSGFTATGKDLGEMGGPLVELADGHPQRAMLLAHLLWQVTPDGGEADEPGWRDAVDTALAYVGYELQSRWTALTTNERRVLRGLVEYANLGGGALAALALPKGSVDGTVSRLLAAGDLERDGGRLRVVDPLFARWVRGLGGH